MNADPRPNLLLDLLLIKEGCYDARKKRPWWHFWPTKCRGGWLTVECGSDGGKSIMWTTHKHTHHPYTPALSISISSDGRIKCYMESAISMWIKWGYGIGTNAELTKAINFAEWAHKRLRLHDKA